MIHVLLCSNKVPYSAQISKILSFQKNGPTNALCHLGKFFPGRFLPALRNKRGNEHKMPKERKKQTLILQRQRYRHLCKNTSAIKKRNHYNFYTFPNTRGLGTSKVICSLQSRSVLSLFHSPFLPLHFHFQQTRFIRIAQNYKYISWTRCAPLRSLNVTSACCPLPQFERI